MPKIKLLRLAKIYEKRGLQKQTALTVAKELTEKDALAALVRDELGLKEMSKTTPIQAAFVSGLAFTIGGVLPQFVTLLLPLKSMEYYRYGSAILFLIILGGLLVKTKGSSIGKAVIRITFGEQSQWD